MTWEEMKPRERDAWIADKVMGWQSIMAPPCEITGVMTRHLRAPGMPIEPNVVCEYVNGGLAVPCLPKEFLPHFSTDIADAMQVMEKLRPFEPELSWNDEQRVWRLHLWKKTIQGEWPVEETIPEAICHAAYEALRSEV